MLPALALGAITLAPRANAATYTYDVGTVDWPITSGYIITSCDNCVLTSANILAWALQSSPGGVSVASNNPGALLTLDGNAMQATPRAITFGFLPGPTFGDAIFASGNQSVDYFSQSLDASTIIEFPNGIGETDACSPGTLLNGSCFGVLNQGTEKIALRTGIAPEIDSASWVAATTLLAGVLLVIRGRRHRIAVWPSARKARGRIRDTVAA